MHRDIRETMDLLGRSRLSKFCPPNKAIPAEQARNPRTSDEPHVAFRRIVSLGPKSPLEKVLEFMAVVIVMPSCRIYVVRNILKPLQGKAEWKNPCLSLVN